LTNQETKKNFSNPILWGVFILYTIVAGFTMFHHELWGDEIHSWNIAKGSSSFFDLIINTRYEGHPPVWYTILWAVSKFTHDTSYLQLIHLLIACAVVFVLLFYSSFPLVAKILIPFGYFFLYEYAVISRNYAIGVLIAFCICIIMHKNFKGKLILYYSLLFLLCNAHILSLLLAGSLHLYYLMLNFEQKKKASLLATHAVIGMIISLPAIYFIFPPPDSGLNIDFWKDRWSMEQIKAFGQAPLRAFTPIPAWWTDNCWNTHFLMEEQHGYNLLRVFNLLLSIILLVSAVYLLKQNKKSLLLFICNLLLSFIMAIMVFPLTRERYAGFLFIGFIVAYWLYCSESQQSKQKKWLITTLLVIQLVGGVIMLAKDIQRPFSNGYRINELLKKVPQNEKLVTDYWAINAVNAFTDKPLYCIDLGKTIPFILWGKDLSEMLAKTNRYTNGTLEYFQREGINKAYMISTGSQQAIFQIDTDFPKIFHVTLIDKIEGAINKGGNLYLYEITSP
jgi:hypothetical protein